MQCINRKNNPQQINVTVTDTERILKYDFPKTRTTSSKRASKVLSYF